MQPRFPLGKVAVRQEAALALSLAGQDAEFFIAKHADGDWGEEGPGRNEQALREDSMILSKYRTLRGHELLVVTFASRNETYLFCPPNSVSRYEPLPDCAHWYKKGEDYEAPR